MKYVNQLTDKELKDMFVYLVKKYYEADNFYDDCYIFRQPWTTVGGNFGTLKTKRGFDTDRSNEVNNPILIELDFDDFNVSPGENAYELNWGMTQKYRKYMFNKYGNQYAIDCFLDEYDEA